MNRRILYPTLMSLAASIGCHHHDDRPRGDFARPNEVVVDERGYRHEGFHDEHHDWHGGYYDERHEFHEDSHDWRR